MKSERISFGIKISSYSSSVTYFVNNTDIGLTMRRLLHYGRSMMIQWPYFKIRVLNFLIEIINNKTKFMIGILIASVNIHACVRRHVRECSPYFTCMEEKKYTFSAYSAERSHKFPFKNLIPWWRIKPLNDIIYFMNLRQDIPNPRWPFTTSTIHLWMIRLSMI